MNQPAPRTLPRTNNCCQRRDGLFKARYPSFDAAVKAAAGTGSKALRPYECVRIPGTYHLTSRGA